MICPYSNIGCPHIDTAGMTKLVECDDCDVTRVRPTGGLDFLNKRLQDEFKITMSRKKQYLDTHKPYVQFALNNYCSHRCWYCCSYPTFKGSKTGYIDQIGIDRYMEFLFGFTQGRVCTFRFGGQEPTEHPLFYDVLLRIVEAGHDIEVITNGLGLVDFVDDRLLSFKHQIKWEMSCHLGVYIEEDRAYRTTELRFSKWMKSYQKALKYGRVYLIIPMVPDMLTGNLDLSIFEGVTFDLIEFYYKGKDRIYPGAYTEEEKRELLRLRNKYMGETSIEEIEAITQINRVLYLKGVPCFYASRIVNIAYDGTYRLCGAGYPPMINSNYKFSDEPKQCPYDSCNCIDLGRQHCLVPHGIGFKEYLPYHKPVKKKLSSDIKRAISKRLCQIKKLY